MTTRSSARSGSRNFSGIEIVVCLAREHRRVRGAHKLRDDLIRKNEAAFPVFHEDAVGQIVDQRAKCDPLLVKALLEVLFSLFHLVPSVALTILSIKSALGNACGYREYIASAAVQLIAAASAPNPADQFFAVTRGLGLPKQTKAGLER